LRVDAQVAQRLPYYMSSSVAAIPAGILPEAAMKKKISDLKTRSVSSSKAKSVKGGAKAGAVTRSKRPIAARAPAARRRP
jgi:hypothetical protein